MKTVLLDSDVFIEVARARSPEILDLWSKLSVGEALLLCTPVTIAEVWHGARPHEHADLSALFASLVCVPIDFEIGRRAGDYLRQFAKSHNLQLGDALIAAVSSVHRAALWTRNRKHYPMKDVTFF